MHTEFITVTKEAADTINARRAAGGRVISVGTTSCRTLESATDENGVVHPISGDTVIFIYPGYRFKAIDALITNFHLPESTLLMLVSALYDREHMLGAGCAKKEKRELYNVDLSKYVDLGEYKGLKVALISLEFPSNDRIEYIQLPESSHVFHELYKNHQ